MAPSGLTIRPSRAPQGRSESVGRLWDQRSAKERAKREFAALRSPGDRAAVMVLYHAAIAAAYGWHDRWITKRPVEPSLDLYADLALVAGRDPLARPFRAAVERYRSAG